MSKQIPYRVNRSPQPHPETLSMQQFHPGPPDGTAAVRGPAGLQTLSHLDTLFVKQRGTLMDVTCCCDIGKWFEIGDSNGEILYTADLELDCCPGAFWRLSNPFQMDIKDQFDQTLILLSMPFPRRMEVLLSPYVMAGIVEEELFCFVSQLLVKNPDGEEVFRITVPIFKGPWCGSVDFQVLLPDESAEVAVISKHWSGLVPEVLNKAGNFELKFHTRLDVRLKALLLGALFMIKFRFYENLDQINHNRWTTNI